VESAGSAAPFLARGLDPRASLLETVLSCGFEGVHAMLEEDRQRLCGPFRRWQEERQAYRHGYDEGRLVLGGRTVRLRKPRVRSLTGQELELPTWRQFATEDPLTRRVLEQIAVGVSTRGYGRSLEAVPDELEPGGISRSAVSRRLVVATQKRVDEFLSRPLADLDLPVILLDGRGMGDHLLVIALGIDTRGKKHVLGVVEGSTESEVVCRGLLSDLVERGLVLERARLFVIDGGKGLRKAVREVFGRWALVQRCRIHKMRNVAGHLPQGKQAWVRAAMRRAWAAPSVSGGRQKLRDLARQLHQAHPGAARSLLEGLDETLTVGGLGLQGWLLRSLSSTNAIENLQGTLARIARNVKRWRGGSMALRWGVTGLLEAEKRFRRVKGYRDIPQLDVALAAAVSAGMTDTKARVA
jgi:transposase-like protein